jgi:hypothetical protein
MRRSVTSFGFGTVMLPNPMYTIGFSSARALAIQSISVCGGVQFNSGLSRNQLFRMGSDEVGSGRICRIEDSLAGDGSGISPIKRFGHDGLDKECQKSQRTGCEYDTGEKL